MLFGPLQHLAARLQLLLLCRAPAVCSGHMVRAAGAAGAAVAFRLLFGRVWHVSLARHAARKAGVAQHVCNQHSIWPLCGHASRMRKAVSL